MYRAKAAVRALGPTFQSIPAAGQETFDDLMAGSVSRRPNKVILDLYTAHAYAAAQGSSSLNS